MSAMNEAAERSKGTDEGSTSVNETGCGREGGGARRKATTNDKSRANSGNPVRPGSPVAGAS